MEYEDSGNKRCHSPRQGELPEHAGILTNKSLAPADHGETELTSISLIRVRFATVR